MASDLRLNLGCSDHHREGYLNVDRTAPADMITDLEQPWPWADSSVMEICAYDVFEHLPFKIHAMNEAWRVLEAGGVLDLRVPCVMLADGRVNPGAFADPTHRSFWTMDDRYYFCEDWNTPQDERGRFGAAYGIQALFRIREWRLVEYGQRETRRSKIMALLEALKA
jgi:predicted SAM-dependent methyltransferase